ncbi:MAG: PLP-dependent aminotransferase family protein [Spirochaetales bacterium]|nr:PLP-dependent aminotransferase family protein [Spirochaetales bacterium]
MLTYSLDEKGTKPIYEFLYECIKNDILSGNLAPDEKLPSKRSFAKNLGISVITVENTYSQLTAEGFIYSLPQKGFFVANIKSIMQKKNPPAKNYTEEKAHGHKKYDIDFSGNQTDSQNFPFSIWAKLMREVLTQRQNDLMKTPPAGGVYELRKAIAVHLKDFRGMKVSPQQIIIGAGTEYLYGLLIQFLGFDKHYGVENPGYSKIAKVYKSHNVECSFINMDKSGVCIDELEKTSTDIIHISPSHHFPTGIVMPISRRYELLAWAASSPSRYIIEDDYDSEFRFSGRPIPTLQSIDISGKVIYMNTFTKTLTSTIRISYMVLPPDLAEKFHSKLGFYSCTVPTFEQFTLAAFIHEGYFEKHINRMRKLYHTKRDLIINALQNNNYADKIEISEEDSGLHFLMRLHSDICDDNFLERLENHGIKMIALSAYYKNPPENAQHYFVVNYTSISQEKIAEAIERIFDCV